jgi:hypothetical protein
MCELYIVLLMKLRKMVFLFFINLTPTSFFRFFLLLCWGYIMVFAKVLTIYQMYRTWIHSSIILFYTSFPHFSQYYFSTYLHVCTIFVSYYPPHPFPIFSLLPLVPTPTGQDLFCPPVLRFCKRKNNDIFACLRYAGSFLVTFCTYICIITWIGSSFLVFSFLP